MIQAVEAEICEDGRVQLCEPLMLQGRHRAVVMVLEPLDKKTVQTGHVQHVLALLDSPEFSGPPARRSEEMEAIIRDNRHAWGVST